MIIAAICAIVKQIAAIKEKRKMKVCTKCGVKKTLSEFNKEKRAKDGHRYACRDCDKKRMEDYLSRIGEEGRKERAAKQRKKRRENPMADRAYQIKYRRTHAAKNLIRHARRRAEKKGIPFDLDKHEAEVQARIDKGRCEMTGTKLSLINGRTHDSPSIDRINPEKGYTIGNIRIVCHLMNCALGDWGEEKLREVMNLWIKGD